MLLMQLAEKKGRWLHEVGDVPSAELPYWIAYYEIKKREQEKAAKAAKSKGGGIKRRR